MVYGKFKENLKEKKKIEKFFIGFHWIRTNSINKYIKIYKIREKELLKIIRIIRIIMHLLEL